ncbi:hypothetical protein STENM223S_01637 [Streptomyces tendae]
MSHPRQDPDRPRGHGSPPRRFPHGAHGPPYRRATAGRRVRGRPARPARRRLRPADEPGRDQPDWGDRDKPYSDEVRAHMRRILDAGLVVAVFPVYWQGARPPQGLDRPGLELYGFAYGRSKPRLAGKRMLWLGLAGATSDNPVTDGMRAVLETNLSEGIAYYCGFSHSSVALLPTPRSARSDSTPRGTCWSATRSREPNARRSTPSSTAARGRPWKASSRPSRWRAEDHPDHGGRPPRGPAHRRPVRRCPDRRSMSPAPHTPTAHRGPAGRRPHRPAPRGPASPSPEQVVRHAARAGHDLQVEPVEQLVGGLPQP